LKRCPRCGRVFPDRYSFCDQDATPLPAARGRVPKAGMAAALGLAIVAVAVFAGPPQLQRYESGHLAVEVTSVSLSQAVPSWPPGAVELKLRVRNSAPFSPVLRSLRFECGVPSHNAVVLEWPPEPPRQLEVAAGRDMDLVLKLSPRTFDPASIQGGLSPKATVVCKGPAAFSLWGIGFSQDLEFETIVADVPGGSSHPEFQLSRRVSALR
jgi:hypothetical protein